jgi:hypothetical protein
LLKQNNFIWTHTHTYNTCEEHIYTCINLCITNNTTTHTHTQHFFVVRLLCSKIETVCRSNTGGGGGGGGSSTSNTVSFLKRASVKAFVPSPLQRTPILSEPELKNGHCITGTPYKITANCPRPNKQGC